MDFSLVDLLVAFAGGLFGAAIGGLPAFIFTGVLVLIGVAVGLAGGQFDVLTNVAFGPFFGPHVSFVGGAAAVAFAKRRGDVENGKDITLPLAGLADPLPLLVGAIFGVAGYLLNQVLAGLLAGGSSNAAFFYAGTYADTIALTVVILGIVPRLIFGKTGIFGSLDDEARARGRFRPGGERVWLAYQEGFLQSTLVGLAFGLLGAYAFTTFIGIDPKFVGAGALLGYGISATSLAFLQLGFSVPVTHHMSLPGAVAASLVVSAGGASLAAILLGAVGGILGALLGEFFSRVFLIHGDSHIDPPALAILVMAVALIIARLALG